MISIKLKIALLLLSAIFVISSTPASAQNQNREIGLRIYGFDNLDFIYKKQKEENKYRRYRLVAGGLSMAFIEDQTAASFSAGIAIGLKSVNP